MESLQAQIKETFYKALTDLLEKEVQQSELDGKTITWLIELCEEMKIRINKFTPRSKALHNELETSIDINLLKQMLQNSAFDDNDLKQLITVIFDRLLMLCAPSQDKEIKMLKNEILKLPFQKAIPKLILETNKIIDSIEEMCIKFAH